MTETAEIEAPPPPPSAIETFVMKVGIITLAMVAFLYCAVYIADSFVTSRLQSMSYLKGGKEFWSRAETKLYDLADQPDLSPERKAKIIVAIKKISSRYRPYIDAIVTP